MRAETIMRRFIYRMKYREVQGHAQPYICNNTLLGCTSSFEPPAHNAMIDSFTMSAYVFTTSLYTDALWMWRTYEEREKSTQQSESIMRITAEAHKMKLEKRAAQQDFRYTSSLFAWMTRRFIKADEGISTGRAVVVWFFKMRFVKKVGRW